jgi:tripartite-type tricarboxylate transporter receptor subunit TctC
MSTAGSLAVKLRTFALLFITSWVAAAPVAAQQPYPSRLVRIVVPYAAGGAVDPMARLAADRLSRLLGQTFIIENRPGAGGNIGIESVVRGPHDGYTLLATPAAVAINPSLYSKVPYDLEKDLTPVGLIFRTPMVVMATPSLSVKTVAELLARAKASPKTLNHATAGNGTLDHLICEHLKSIAGVEITRVTYQGVPKGITALLTGEVQMMVVAANAALPYIRSGQLIPLAVTGSERSAELPEVPTMKEAGFADFVFYGWGMLFAPSGTPPEIAQKLNAEMAKVVAEPEVKKIIADLGGETRTLPLDELKAYVKHDADLFATIVRQSGAKVE